MTSNRYVLSAFILVAGCSAQRGTQPHDMSAAEHQRAAAADEKLAAEHEGRADPGPVENCNTAVAPESSGQSLYNLCWSTVSNASWEHERDAQRHREAARKHRQAAQALMSAEASACRKIAPRDRDVSPFFHRTDIASVIEVSRETGDTPSSDLLGVSITFGKVPGLTEESLRALVDCHIARAAAVGHEMPEMDYCPLVLHGAQAKVVDTSAGLSVRITSDDPVTATAIAERGRALLHRGPREQQPAK